MSNYGTAKCPICGTDQHVTSVGSDGTKYLGCLHAAPPEEAAHKPLDEMDVPEGTDEIDVPEVVEPPLKGTL